MQGSQIAYPRYKRGSLLRNFNLYFETPELVSIMDLLAQPVVYKKNALFVFHFCICATGRCSSVPVFQALILNRKIGTPPERGGVPAQECQGSVFQDIFTLDQMYSAYDQ